MTTRAKGWALVGVAATLIAGPAIAQESATVLKDLTAVIGLQGLPCGQVESDYLASCQEGNRYRVFTKAQGRVIVQKQ